MQGTLPIAEDIRAGSTNGMLVSFLMIVFVSLIMRFAESFNCEDTLGS